MAAIGALAAGLIIEPWGMITTVAIVLTAVVLTRRSRFFLALIFLGVVCVALALANGNRSERISLGTPLACLALCLLVYLADVWLSMHYVRRIWRKSARQEKAESALRAFLADGSLSTDNEASAGLKSTGKTPARSGLRQWPYSNGIKLSRDWHTPEDDLGQGCQPGDFAWLASLVPAPWPLGLAFVAAPGAGRDEVAVPGDLGGQVGGKLVKERRGKSIRSR
jgi:hypothetical protein